MAPSKPSESEARRLLRPFIERGEVLTVTMVTISGAPALLARVAKRDAAIEESIRDALRGKGWRVEIAGPKGAAR